MNRITVFISAATLLGTSSVAAVAPASAAMYQRDYQQTAQPQIQFNMQYQQQDQYVGNFCERHPGASRCSDWQRNHVHWSRNQYRDFYRQHQNEQDFGSNVAASIFGLAAGAIVAGAVNNANNGYSYRGNNHVIACEQAYRSYNPRTDTFVGYDGRQHQCRL